MPVHPTAIVSPAARIAETAEIGPYSIIGGEVEIGAGTRLMAHVYMEGPLRVGEDNVFFPYSTVGVVSQDLKYHGERAETRIGNRNKIREFVTIHRGTEGGGLVTSIGDDNLLMAYVHVAHDVHVGNRVVLANAVTLGGHVTGGRLGGDRSFDRRAPVLPRRAARDHRRIQRGDAGCAAVFEYRERARDQGVRRQPDRPGAPRIRARPPSRNCRPRSAC
jgi:carbonic anhydrase/acetyltransferase-like protein (isoleucine patch superfamily)